MIRVPVSLRRTVDESHDIRIGRGLGPRISVDLRRLSVGQRYIIVTESNVHRRYVSDVLVQSFCLCLFSFPAHTFTCF